jgi:enterochelin esterase-like enzyme
MNNPMLRWIVFLIAMLAAAQTLPQGVPGRGGPQRIAGVEVRPDRTILFRIAAPKATEVSLVFSESDPKPRPMAKDAGGVWSLTVGPVEPEIYRYWFVVDGVKTIDVSNRNVKISSVVDASLVEVPGDPPRFDQFQNVPHGSVNVHTYTSKTLGRQRALCVYVPPQYYSQTNKRFPVLYLWHGGGGSELDWVNEGRTDVILDNLIAQKKAVPMIIVIPNGDVGGPGPSAAPGAPPSGAGMQRYDVIEKETVSDIIPLIERHYRTLSNRENRAIAGLSAGGGISINVGLKRLDLFAWVGEFSSGMFGGVAGYAPFDVEKISPGFLADPAATNKRLKLLYFSCGEQDPRMPYQVKAAESLRAQKINLTFRSFPGVHEWKVWRHSLADMAPLLFMN